MGIFKSTDSIVHQHIYGYVTMYGDADYQSSVKGFTVQKRGTGLYVVSFTSLFKMDPSVTLSLYTEMQAPYIGANSIHLINVDPSSFYCSTLKGDQLVDSGFSFIAFGEV